MQPLTQIKQQIRELEIKRDAIKEDNFKKASKHWFTLLNAEYESSSVRTKQYLTFCRVFKRQFKKLLHDNFDIVKIEISKPNHFDQHGFFELKNGNTYYFSIGDLRWDKCFLIRTAKDFKDHTGGSNDFCNTEDFGRFMKDLKSIVQNDENDKNLYSFSHDKCGTSLMMATKKEAENNSCSKCGKSFSEDES